MFKKTTFFLLMLTLFLPSCITAPVTGKKSFVLLPFDQEVQMGQDAYSDFMSKQKNNINRDPKVNALVKQVATRLARVSDMPNLKWEFTVINSKEVNAFCLPGGKIVVYTGILPLCKDEAGLAAVLGHEMGHAVARHGAQRITQQLGITLGMSLASVTFKNSKYQDVILAGLGAGATIGILLPYSRDDEYEADEIGTTYMARAGYDPKEAVVLWQRFSHMEGQRQPEFLQTHPYSEKRASRLKSIMSKIMVEYKKSPQYGLGENL